MTSASTKTICSGTAVSLALTSDVASGYTWIATANANITGESTTTQSTSTIGDNLVNTTSTTQNVVYTVTPSSTTGSCAGTPQTVTITVNPAPTMTSANTKTICSGTAVGLALTSVNPSSYSWIATANANVTGASTTIQSTATINDNLVNTTTSVQTVTYTVTPTSTTGSCAGTPQTVTVTVNPVPTMSSANAKTICSGTAVGLALTSVVPSSYSWIATANANVTGTSTTAQSTTTINDNLVNSTAIAQNVVYTVTPTSTTGSCAGTSQTVTITVNPTPAVSNSPLTQTICSGGNSALVTLTSNVTGTTFAWTASSTAGVSGFTASGTSTIPVQTISTTGTTQGTVTYAITPTASGCPGSVTNYTVLVNPKPIMTSASTKTICSGTAVSLSLTSDVASGYTWIAAANTNVTGASTTTQSTNTISDNLVNTTVTVQNIVYTVTPTSTTGGCAGTPQTVTVIVNPTPTVSNTPLTQTICSGGNSTLVTLTSNVTGATFTWTASATAGVSGFTASGTSTIPAQTISTTGTTQGTVTYVISPTASGCSGPATNYTVLVNPKPAVSNSPLTQTICSGGSSTLVTLASNVTGATFAWTATATSGVSGFTGSGTSSIPVQTISTSGTTQGTVTYAITPTASGCPGSVTNYTILVNPTPTVSNSPLTQTICSGGSSTLVTLTSNVSGATFAWTATATTGVSGFTTSGTSSIPIQTISTTAAIQGTVTYVITPTAAGCSGTATNYTILVNPATMISNQSTSTQSTCLNVAFSPISVTATGTGVLTYQWFSNTSNSNSGGTLLTGATNNSYTPSATVAGTLYYYCIVHGNCGSDIVSSVSGAFVVIADLTWTGKISSDWNNTGNWSCPFLPDLTKNVLIPGSLTNYPILSTGATGMAKNIVINTGSSLTVTGKTLQIAGTISNSGTFTASSGTIEMIETSGQTIPSGAFATTTIQNLTVTSSAGVSQ